MSERQENSKKISVSIGGISYQLVSQENEAYTREIARKADEAIRQIVQQHPSLSTMQAIILAIVNTFDALTKQNDYLEETKAELETIENRSASEIENIKIKMVKAQHELFALRDADFELKKEFLRISELNKQLELEIASLRKKQSTSPISSLTFGLDQPADAAEQYAGNADLSYEADEIDHDYKDYDEGADEGIDKNSDEDSDSADLPALDDQDDSTDPFLNGTQNPFAVSADILEDPAGSAEIFPGYKQPSLEDLFE